jgi:hypothetical protein
MRAIKNIGKITKAMKMVAASKMRNAQTAVEHSRGIVEPFVRLFGDYPGMCTQVGGVDCRAVSDRAGERERGGKAAATARNDNMSCEMLGAVCGCTADRTALH